VPTRVAGLEGRLTTAYDFTGDLKSDVLWRHATGGDVWLWPMDGAAGRPNRTCGACGHQLEIRGWGPDRRRKADILWRHKVSGDIYFWPMDGATLLDETYVATVDRLTTSRAPRISTKWQLGLLWRHKTNGAV